MTATPAPAQTELVSVTFGADADALAGFPNPSSAGVAFGDDTWDFSDLEGLAPNLAPATWRVEWASFANPAFRLAAKEVLFAKLHPDHPAVIEALGWRRAMSIRSIGPHIVIWRAWFTWLEDNDVHRLCDVGPHHWEAYLARRRRDGVSDQHLALTVKRIREFYDYALVLTASSYAHRPWGRRTAWNVAGVRRRTENATAPIPDEVFGPLVGAALHLVTHADTIIAARDVHMDLCDYRCTPSAGRPGGDPKAQRAEHDRALLDLIEAHRHEARPLPAGAMRGHGPDKVNLRLLGLWAGLSPKVLAAPHRRAWLNAAAAELGVAQAPLARSFDEHPDDLAAFGQVIWGGVIRKAVQLLVAACYVVIAMSGMRGEEITALRRGCVETVVLRNGDRRIRLRGRIYKHQGLGGAEASWVVTDQIAAAVAVLERLAPPEEELLFSPATLLTYRRTRPPGRRTISLSHYLANFCFWLAEGDIPPELERLPAGTRVVPRQFRRTMARALAFRPHGVVAGKVHLKHLHIATSEGYYGRANSSLAAFHDEIESEAASARLEAVKNRYLAYMDGAGVAGGARKALDRHFSEIATEMADFAGTTLEADRHLEGLLADKLGKLHIGVVNDCWFIDPERAACRNGDDAPAAPRPNACVGDRCTNAVVTAVHLPVYRAAHEQVVSLRRSRKVSAFEKERLAAEQSRLEAVIDAVEVRP